MELEHRRQLHEESFQKATEPPRSQARRDISHVSTMIDAVAKEVLEAKATLATDRQMISDSKKGMSTVRV
eukprot:scaffold897_cov402-Prasinococcus_capsulatus_cf.AAC.10